MRNLIAVFVAILLFLPPAVQAQGFDLPLIDLRLGIRGGPNVNILPDVVEDDPEPVYPGFYDVGYVIGGALSFDYMGTIGIAIELLYSVEPATGTVEFSRDVGEDNTKEESEFILETTRLHFPIYIRAQIPSGVAQAFVHLGVDLVLSSSDQSLTVSQRGDAPAFFDGCTPGEDCDPFPDHLFDTSPIDSMSYFLVGIGLNIDVTAVTVPVEIRGLFNLGLDDSIETRARVNSEGVALYNDEWNYQVMVLFGLDYVIF
jgi:hypothetical protein